MRIVSLSVLMGKSTFISLAIATALFRAAVCHPATTSRNVFRLGNLNINARAEVAGTASATESLDPSQDFRWIQHWASLGDSYAAAIGAGGNTKGADSYYCSRYDGGYASLMEQAFGEPQKGSYRNWQFYACSGETSVDIKKNQVPRLKDGSQQLITMSAGGNDVGFSVALKACILLPTTQDACDKALKASEDSIENELEGNIKALAESLLPKLAEGGFVVWTLYGKFFNEEPGHCDNERWCFFDLIIRECLPLKDTLRKRFNELVGKANIKISKALEWVKNDKEVDIRQAKWGGAPRALHGRFCEPDSAHKVDDYSNRLLAFIRQDTDQTDLKVKRQANLTFMGTATANPTGTDVVTAGADTPTPIAKGELNAWHKDAEGQTIPDSLLKLFHPTRFGHYLIFLAAMAAVEAGEAAKLQIGDGMGECTIHDAPKGPESEGKTCYGQDGKKWAGSTAMRDAVNQFCGDYQNLVPSYKDADKGETRLDFFDGYEDALSIGINWSTARLMPKTTCTDSFMKIVSGCDGDRSPGWYKFGGTFVDYKYGTMFIDPKIDGYHEHRDCEDPKSPDVKDLYAPDWFLAEAAGNFCRDHGGIFDIKPQTIVEQETENNQYGVVKATFQWLLPASDSAVIGFIEDECKHNFQKIIDQCPSTGEDPDIWKYGGVYTVDELQFTLEVLGRSALDDDTPEEVPEEVPEEEDEPVFLPGATD
ncbi:MAG: hypothetical protein M1833_001409 [Piccolia ochrophora]|nr:MAG: hypothetical protein M1833_001409 [Piccolia ochrophora]